MYEQRKKTRISHLKAPSTSGSDHTKLLFVDEMVLKSP